VLHAPPISFSRFDYPNNILLSTLFSDTLSLCSSLSVRDQVSHPYRTTGKITVLCILKGLVFVTAMQYVGCERRNELLCINLDWF
jgi:hypothetical protein